MSALFWAQIKDLTRRVEALEAAEKARSAPQGDPFFAVPGIAECGAACVQGEVTVATLPVKRGPGRPKKQ